MRRVEHPTNTPDQIREYLRDALAIVDEIAPPDDLREVCFAKAVDLCSAKQILVEQAVMSGLPLRP